MDKKIRAHCADRCARKTVEDAIRGVSEEACVGVGGTGVDHSMFL